MGKVIAVANQKGGVAKTTSTHNLGAALARDYKVLLIDFDSQASLTISLGFEPIEHENNIVTVLRDKKKKIRECILEIKPNLHVITSIIDLAQLEIEMLSRHSREKILERALGPIREEYDYILIDCPPQLSILTINALSCADSVLIPMKTDYLAYRGLDQLLTTIEDIRELVNPDLEIMGVLATLYEKIVTTDNEVLELLKEKDQEVRLLGIIKKKAMVKKGLSDSLCVVEQYPQSDVAKEYIKVAQMISEGKI